METWEAGFLRTHDKMELKKDYAAKEFVSFRASARYGAYISSGVIMMPNC
jgi:2,3,4,5-tetrahydropyridine-2-carboxylate N-succinyltransferase